MTTYTVSLLKGGSTKTTTAAEIVAHLAAQGRRVLAIDLDQQANLTTRMGLTRDSEIEAAAYDVVSGATSPARAATPSPALAGVHVLVGTHDLAYLDQRPEVITSLRLLSGELAEQFDDVVIDTPPALGVATMAGLAAADVIVAAVACETEAFDQIPRLSQVIEHRIRASRINPDAGLDWIVPTRFHPRRLLDQELLGSMQNAYPGRITPPVREAVAARDAYTAGLPVSTYSPGSKIAADYRAVMEHITRKAPK